jgi:hypothetical protein
MMSDSETLAQTLLISSRAGQDDASVHLGRVSLLFSFQRSVSGPKEVAECEDSDRPMRLSAGPNVEVKAAITAALNAAG